MAAKVFEVGDALPATTLSDYCYYNMFYGCAALINTTYYLENPPM